MPPGVKSKEEILRLSLEELQNWALQQQAALETRELQLERKFEEVAHMQEVTNQLMVFPPNSHGLHSALSKG